MKIYERLFIYLTTLMYILFALAHLKLWNVAQLYLDKITYYYNLLIAIVLMYYFNPFIKTQITEIHRKMIFTAAFLVFVTIGVDNLINDLKQKSLIITNNKDE